MFGEEVAPLLIFKGGAISFCRFFHTLQSACRFYAAFMLIRGSMTKRMRILSGLLALGILLPMGFGSIAFAQNKKEGDQFRSLFATKDPVSPYEITRFDAQGIGKFTLDRTHAQYAFLKFDNSDEVWVLSDISGPRGDIFLRNDITQVVLRFASVGGATLYKNDPNGVPAQIIGKAESVIPLEKRFSGSIQKALEIAANNFENRGLDLGIEVSGSLPAALVCDALNNLNIALAQSKVLKIAASKGKLGKIRISRAPQTFVLLRNGIMEIGLTPGISYGGRPSSAAFAYAIGVK